MTLTSVIVAAAAAWIWGIVWYMAMARPWAEAAGLAEGKPGIDRKVGALISFLCLLVVAGMMRHALGAAGIFMPGKAFVGGLGLGLFVATPFLVLSYLWQGRPVKLMLIDGAHVSVATAVIGLFLVLV